MRIRRPSPTMPSCLAQMSASSRHSAGLSCAICAWTRVESPPIKIASRARARRTTVNPGSARRPSRAGHLPQRRERLLRAQGEGARPSRSGDRRGPCRHHLRRRVDHRFVRMDQRSSPRPATQARFLKTSAPSSIDGIEKYLGSGMIRGVGPSRLSGRSP